MFKKSLALVALFVAIGSANLFAQADALVEMLQKKGLLTTREANEVKEQMFRDVREQMPGTKINVGGWLDELRIYGDTRVRYEQFWDRRQQAAGTAATIPAIVEENDRTRFRFRLRAGLTAKAGDWEAGFRLASGDTDDGVSDAVSTNTTFDNWASKKAINIDLAYLKWNVGFIKEGALSLSGGKMENPFWETDMVYDGDLTPEGFAQQYSYKFNDNYGVFANLSQWVLGENNTTSTQLLDGSRGKDSYMLGYQVGHEWKIVPRKVELKQAVAYYDYVGLRNEVWAAGGNLFNGAVARNSMTSRGANSVLDPSFNVLAVNNEVKLGFWEKYPIRLQGEYINNLGDYFNGTDAGENQGFKVGAVLGEAKKKGQWQVGYWYERLENNATVSWLSDSDFGFGGTGNMGHIVKAQYAVTDFISLGVAYWNVQSTLGNWNSGARGAFQPQEPLANTERFQFDVAMKF